MDGGDGFVGLLVFIFIVGVAVVLGITMNEYLQAAIDGKSATSATA